MRRVPRIDRVGPRPPAVEQTHRSKVACALGACVLACVVLVIELRSRGAAAPTTRQGAALLIPEYAGAITDWVLCLPQNERHFFEDAQADLVAKARPDVRMHVFTPGDDSERAFRKALARHGVRDGGSRVSWQRTKVPFWPWVRDAFVAGRDPDGTGVAYVPTDRFRPRLQQSAHDADLMDLVRRAHARGVPLGLPLEGGAVLVDEGQAFVSERAARDAVGMGLAPNATQLGHTLRALWGLPVEFLPTRNTSRSEHIDLLLMPVGGRRVVLGSPRLASELLHAVPAAERARFLTRVRAFGVPSPAWPGNEDLARTDAAIYEDILRAADSPEVVRGLAVLEARLEAMGYQVHHVPYVCMEPHPDRLSLVVTYTNVVFDAEGADRIVYLPSCGLQTLDRSAVGVWRKLGYRVVPIDALGPALQSGAVRCLVQTFRR